MIEASRARSELRGERRSSTAKKLALVFAVTGPALWIGGAPPSALIVVSVGVVLLTTIIAFEGRRWRWPQGWIIGVALLAYTLASLVPLPPDLLALLQPQPARLLREVGPAGWRPWSLNPAGTWLEAGELALLCSVFLLGAQFSWRTVAGVVSLTAVAVAGVGLVQSATDTPAVLGLYAPRLVHPNPGSFLTTFINPNHQASLFLLGAAAGLGVGRSLHRRARRSGDATQSRREADLARVALASSAALVVAIVLSFSRGGTLALGVVAVAVAGVLLRSRRRHGPRGGGDTGSARRIACLAPVALTVLVAAALAWRGPWRQPTWAETSLADALQKPSAVAEGLMTWRLSPWLGVGRGAFVDAFVQVTTRPSEPVLVHIESIPATAVVEWGLVGAAAILALGVWWIYMYRETASPSARIAALGLMGVAVHAVLEFSPDLLGVSVPMVALAGSLAPHRGGRHSKATPTLLAALGALIAVSAYVMAPMGSFATRIEHGALLEDDGPLDPDAVAKLIRQRPLDARLRVVLARNLAASGDWDRALELAHASRTIDPRRVDAWVLESEALDRTGQADEARAVLVVGLTRLEAPPSVPFARYVVARLGDPASVAAAVAPSDGAKHLAETLSRTQPAHAQAIVARLARGRALDADLTRIRARASLRLGDDALALHFAELLRQLNPDDGEAYVFMAQAMARLDPASSDTRIETLDQAIERPRLKDRDLVDEVLFETLVERGRPEDIERARVVGSRLLRYHAKTRVLARRRALVDRLPTPAGAHPR